MGDVKLSIVETIPGEADLEWYFTRGNALFSRSVTGAMLEKLAAESAVSVECPACFVDTSDPDEHGKPRRWPGLTSTGEWCPYCNGTGHLAIVAKTARCKVCGGGKHERHNCSHCLGTGIEPVSAAPLAGHEWSVGLYEIDTQDAQARRAARVSRRLLRARDTLLATEAVLEAYLGHEGQAWSSRSTWGRHFAVFPLTIAGKDLDELAQLKGDTSGTTLDRLHRLNSLESAKPRLEQAASQAVTLVRGAAAAWEATDG